MEEKETIDNDICRALAQLSHLYGVRHVVVSPGTRSAPIAVAMQRSRLFEVHVVVDERCAAFMALGIWRATHRPVVLVCTSGSALLNYAPALSEAYYDSAPLIVVSADRPIFQVDQLDGQTMRQHGALAAVVRRSVDIPAEASAHPDLFRKAMRDVNEAFDAALCGVRGPVHVNVHLDTPLTRLTTKPPHFPCQKITSLRPAYSDNDKNLSRIIDSWQGKRVAIVCGSMDDDTTSAILNQLSPRITVLREAQSNVCTDGSIPVGIIDRRLDDGLSLLPDIVVTIGGTLVSSRLKKWLRNCDNACHVAVGCSDNIHDTFGKATMRIDCPATDFLPYLASLEPNRQYYCQWQALYADCVADWDEKVKSIPILTALHSLANDYDGILMAGNGSAIRYIQYMHWRKATILCNRGINGIDGCTSTAVGIASATESPVLLLTGDMSAAYDIGALAATVPPENLCIVVIDNNGGDIFRNIATRHLPECEQLFAAPPRLPLAQLADAYGYNYAEYQATQGAKQPLYQTVKSSAWPLVVRVTVNPETTKNLI